MSSVSEFRAEFPEFVDVDDSTLARKLDIARLFNSSGTTATLYCMAHLVAIAKEATGAPDGGSGVVESEQIGPRRIAYLNQASKDERRVFFDTTPYGRLFSELEQRSPRSGIGARVV